MLARASVSEVKSGKVSKARGAYLVVAMRVYPRFLRRELTDEYQRSLSPAAELFARYRALKKESGLPQNEAFEQAGYEAEFELGEEGMKELSRLTHLALAREVYLVCQCAPEERCHGDLMLLIAERKFGARIGELPFTYEVFRKRNSKKTYLV